MMEEYEKFLSIAKTLKDLRSTAVDCLEASGLGAGDKIPSGVGFWLAYLFQPFRLSFGVFAATGQFPKSNLSGFFPAEIWQNETVGINATAARHYARQILFFAFIILSLPLGAALVWAHPLNEFWVLIASGLIVFFFQLFLGKLKGCVNVTALAIFIALITGGYAWIFKGRFFVPSPLAFAITLAAIALAAYRASGRVVALFTTAAATLASLLFLSKGVESSLAFGALGFVTGLVWDSADILTEGSYVLTEPEGSVRWQWRWRVIIVHLIFIVLLFLFTISALNFSFIPLRYVEKVPFIFGPMIFGFSIGYFRFVEILAINLYQFLLYLIERFSGKVTIHHSPVMYHDAHHSILSLAPHLTLAYRREPELAMRVLHACAMAPGLSQMRKRVLRRLMPDAFLSFNSINRPAAQHLAGILKNEGLTLWYDQEKLTLGRTSWEADISMAIMHCKAAVILIGKEGYGPYQKREINFCLVMNLTKQLPIIPIFLPGAEINDDLKQFTFVDLRKDVISSLFTEDTIQRLKLGIMRNR